MVRSGALREVRGVVLGSFLGCEEPGQPDWDAEAIAGEILGELGIPVVAGLPVGHGPENRAFRWGAVAVLEGGVLSF
jgi:muramoyltetrapeptide carboxypeptidase